jgi:hypothetical protein
MFEMILFFNELMLQSISLPLMPEDRGIFALTLVHRIFALSVMSCIIDFCHHYLSSSEYEVIVYHLSFRE